MTRTITECSDPKCHRQRRSKTGLCDNHAKQVKRAQKYVLGHFCPNGHMLTMQNLGQDGYRRWCKDDHLGARRANAQKAHEAYAKLSKPGKYYHRLMRVFGEDDNVLGKDDRPSAPWMLLRPKPHARAAWDKFNEALTEENPRCVGNPADYADYAEQGEEPRPGQKPFPLAFQARELCVDCPLFKLCGDFAKAEQPTAGVWAGQAWVVDENNATGYKGKRAYG